MKACRCGCTYWMLSSKLEGRQVRMYILDIDQYMKISPISYLRMRNKGMSILYVDIKWMSECSLTLRPLYCKRCWRRGSVGPRLKGAKEEFRRLTGMNARPSHARCSVVQAARNTSKGSVASFYTSRGCYCCTLSG
jgi:hypothetical protein